MAAAVLRLVVAAEALAVAWVMCGVEVATVTWCVAVVKESFEEDRLLAARRCGVVMSAATAPP